MSERSQRRTFVTGGAPDVPASAPGFTDAWYADPLALSREYPCYDPVHLLPDEGRGWWLARAAGPELVR